MVKAMRNWQNNMASELDFIQEASNLKLMHDALLDSKLNCIIPQLIFPQSIQRKRVLVMSRIYGYKVTDKLAIAVHNIHKTSLVTQIAHCCAYQMLQKGVFNGRYCTIFSMFRVNVHFLPSDLFHFALVITADPHPGNIFFCLTKMQVVPGLLDFGMTVRLSKETRLLYCELVLALFDGDMQAAASCLNRLGYATNQTHRAPERDAEFFEYLLRDAAVSNAFFLDTCVS
ncbi:hypothetical protein EON65_18200 [archaeon]|nr:MAG: hypothetical protein EON65_18200 [archaeon]